MISLVITIIVLIILSAIAFFASNDTIANATYSTYVSNVAEVASAFEKTALDMNSEEELIKDPKLDEQIYNYVARGGENLEFLEYEELPYYTLISEEVSIGMDLPSMKIESGTGHVIPIKYASTLQGKIFTWPPYEHEGKLYITQEDTVEHKMQEQITVGGERLTIVIDSGDGSLLEAPSGEGYYEPDWGEDLPFESTPPDQEPDQEAHLFTSKTPTPEYLVSEATCTTPAIYYYKCISCDLKGTTTYTYEKALGHQWDTYKITKVATCNESGTKQRECLRCKDVETVVIAKDTKNHVGSEVEEVTRVASCTETERKTTKCSACNVVLKVQEGNKNPDNHTGGESTQVTKPATCTENGTKVTSCVGCNKVLKTEAIPAFGHSFGNFVEVKEPTCSVKGVKQKTCTTCGTTENEEIPLDANNHKGSTAGEERTEPTCTENGKIVRKCSLCGGTLSTETILYLGHKYNSVVTEPTLEAGGYTTHTCERCGDTYQDNFTEKLSLEAYAIYSETDKSLRFYKNTDKVKVGDTYENLKVTGKYEDIETSIYTSKELIPWFEHSGDILKVVVEEEVMPISTARWFYGLTNVTSIDLSRLNTSKVTTMECMFYAAVKLKSIDVSNFDTSSLEDMDAMFSSHSNYGDMALTELDLSNFDTSKVISMQQIFQRCRNIKTLNLTGWDTSKVTDMQWMFNQVGYNCENVEILGLNNWDTSSVMDMNHMFYSVGYNAKTWNIGDLSNWDTSSVTTMEYAFAYAGNNVDAFILDLSNWDTSSVTDMGYMFYATGENSTTWNIGDLSDWDISKVKFLDCVFAYAGKTTTSWSIGDLSNWNTSSALNMTSMFAQAGMNATTFNLGNLDNWDTAKVINMSNLFSNAGKNSSTWNVGNLSKWNTSNVTNMYQMFGFTGLKASTFDIGDLSTKTVTKADGTTYTAWDTSKVTDMGGMFTWGGYGASTFDIGNIGTWDVSSVTKMNYMFNQAGCYATTWNIGDLSNWNTKSVTSLYGTFHMAGYNATTFDIGDLSTKLVTKANGTTYTAWDVSKVTTMYRLFGSAGRVASEFNLGDIGTWNISNLKEMQYMFAGAGQQSASFYVGDLSGLNTANVTNMLGIFENAGKNSSPITLDLSNWNTSKVTYAVNESGEITSGMNDMFTGMRRLHTITLGENFSTTGDGTCTFSLPTIDKSYFTNSDGKWYDVATGIGYEPDAIPTNTAATYSVEPPIEAYAIYSETDNSLRFYKNTDKVNVGDTYNNIEVTEIYTGFEEEQYGFEDVNTNTRAVWVPQFVAAPWNENPRYTKVYVEEKISPISTAAWFYDVQNLEYGDFSYLDTSNVTNMMDMFNNAGINVSNFEIVGLSNWDVSKVTNMSAMFQKNGETATEIIIDDISGWDTSNVTDMSYMFAYSKVSKLDLSNWDTTSATDMSGMFKDCTNLVSFNGGKSLKGDLNGNGIVDFADAQKCMELWLNDSATAEDIRIADINGDGEINMTDSNIIANYISSANTTYIKSPLNFITTSVTNMTSMFEGCSNLEALDLTTFNTSAVTNMDNMFKGCINLEVVNLGPNFAFKSTSGYLPAQTSDNVENADGNWYNMETMVGYAPSAIPNNTAASYTSIINGTKIPVDGLGDVITNDPDIELEYDPDDGTLGGAVPPAEDEPEEPAEMPEDKKPEIIEVGFGDFEPVTTYTPGTYKEVPYEQSFTKTKYPVSYLTVTWSEWTITKDADGNVISTTAGDMQLEDIDKVYSTWIVYDMETEKYLESNGVKGDSMEIWAPFIAEKDSLENMVYLAAYLNKIDGKTSRHIAKHDGTKYVAYDADAQIAAVTCFTETYTVTGTKTVEVTKPSSSTEYVYVPTGTIRAEKDMTWETWLNSSYNTTGNKTPTIKTSDYVDVAYTDVIDENLDYGFIVYELDGIWLWNDDADFDTLMNDIGGIVNINFTANEESFVGVKSAGGVSAELLYYKNESEYITAYGYLGATQGTAMVCSWNTDYQIIDFGSKPQEVSKEFYEWFVANAQEQMEVLSGVYIWNDEINLDLDEVYAEEVNYTSNGQQYTWIHAANESRLTPNGTITESYAIHYGDNGNYMQSAIEGGIDVSGIGPMSWSIQSDLGIANPGNDIYVWLDDAYKIIDFGSPQIVSKNFYDWFLENAKPTLSGIYEWNDSISYPDSEVFGMFEEYMDFSSNGATYPLLQVEWYEMEKYISYYNGSSASVIAHNSSSGWNEENYKTIDFGSTPQAVSKEFYEWFNANASPMSFEAVNGTTWEFAPTKLINNESDATYALKLSISKDSTKVLQNVEANLHIHSGTGGGLLLLADGENITIKYIDFAATKYILTIHGGEDAENPDLIEWLLSNATLVGVHKTCSYGDYVVTTAATCTTDGVKTKTCTECGSTETEVIRATGHNYESVVTAPTLESQGYTTHTCSKCGDSYKDSYTDKLVAKAFAIYSQTDGSLRFYNNADTPTVGSTYKERAVTSVYTGFETEEYSSSNLPPWHYDIISSVVVEEVVSPISTAYWFYLSNVEDYDLTNLDTSNVTSMSYMFVEDDNKYIGSPYSIVGMDNWDTSKVIDMSYMFDTTGVNSPTYNIGDLSGWDTSSVENMSHMFASSGPDASTWDVGDLSGWDTSKVTNFEAMFFNAGTSSSGITLDLSGWNTTKATNMTNMFYEARRVSEIKLGSNFSTNGNGTVTDFAFPTIDTTYFTNSDGKWYNASTKVGYEPNAIPTNTAATYTVEVQDPCAAGHTYGDWTTTTAATCSTAGSKYRTCTVCGNEETTTIAATGHSYSSTYLSDATNHWQKCENCSSTTNTGAHSYGSWTTTKAATCSTAGSKYRTCGTCGYKQTQTIEKTGHDYSVSSSTAGDCNTASTTTYKCDNCGNTYTSTGDYGSHSYSVSSSTAGDCNTASTTTYRCSECGNTYTSTGGYGSHDYENTCSTALTNAGCSHKTCSECGATTGSHIDPCTH